MIVCNGHYKLTLESWVGRSSLNMCQLFKPRLWVFTSIHPYHSIWTGTISHNKYNEWWNNAEIGNDCLQQSLQADFGVVGGEKLPEHMCQLFTPRLWVFTSIHPYHSIWTGPISHNEYNEWWNKAEIGNDCLQRSLQADFGVMGGEKWPEHVSTFQTKIVSVYIHTPISQHLDWSNLSQ